MDPGISPKQLEILGLFRMVTPSVFQDAVFALIKLARVSLGKSIDDL